MALPVRTRPGLLSVLQRPQWFWAILYFYMTAFETFVSSIFQRHVLPFVLMVHKADCPYLCNINPILPLPHTRPYLFIILLFLFLCNIITIYQLDG